MSDKKDPAGGSDWTEDGGPWANAGLRLWNRLPNRGVEVRESWGKKSKGLGFWQEKVLRGEGNATRFLVFRLWQPLGWGGD